MVGLRATGHCMNGNFPVFARICAQSCIFWCSIFCCCIFQRSICCRAVRFALSPWRPV